MSDAPHDEDLAPALAVLAGLVRAGVALARVALDLRAEPAAEDPIDLEPRILQAA